MGNKGRKKKGGGLIKPLLLFILLVLVVIAFTVGIAPERFFSKASVFPPVDGEEYISGETFNIALLGFDRTKARDSEYSLYRPDTIMIAAVNFKSGKLSLLSIPRDSYVKISGTNLYDKINHAYMHGYYQTSEDGNRHLGGVATTIKTIENFLGGLAIHGYVLIDMDGAATVVDRIGGVEIEVEEEIRANYGQGDLLVPAGKQRLDSSAFMQYVRNRADNLGGERGRTERQQKAMIAMFRQLFSLQGMPALPSFIGAVSENVDHTLNPLQIVALGLVGLRTNYGNLEGYVFGGTGKYLNRDGQNVYYLLIDGDDRLTVIEKVFGIKVERLDEPDLHGPIASEPEPELAAAAAVLDSGG